MLYTKINRDPDIKGENGDFFVFENTLIIERDFYPERTVIPISNISFIRSIPGEDSHPGFIQFGVYRGQKPCLDIDHELTDRWTLIFKSRYNDYIEQIIRALIPNDSNNTQKS